MFDPVSLIGVIISAGGVIQSAWLNKKQQTDMEAVKERLRLIEGAIHSQGQGKLEDLKHDLERAGVTLSSHGNLPSTLKPIQSWARDLEKHTQGEREPESFLVAEDAGKVTLWKIDKAYLSRFLYPTRASKGESEGYYIAEDPMFMAALQMLKQNQVDIALRLLSQLYRANVSDADWRLLNNLAVCYLKSNKPETALETIDAAHAGDSEGAAIISFNKAVILYELEHFREAQIQFALALRHPALADDALVGMLDCASRTDEAHKYDED